MNIKHYNINNCRLFAAKDFIEKTGITVTNASVVTRMLARYAPFTQTAKEWRDAGANIPASVRDNKKLMTEQQAARYLSHIPQKDCPKLHKMFKEIKEFSQDGDRVFEGHSLVFEYDTQQRYLMEELESDSEYFKKMVEAAECPGMIIDYPLELEIYHRHIPDNTYTTKVEVPLFDSVNGIAHFYITSEQMTKWHGASFYGEGTVEMKSKEYEELKKIATAVCDKVECEYVIHVIEKEDSPTVTLRDGSYYFPVRLVKDMIPF